MAIIKKDKKAPDAEIVLSDGKKQRLSDLWKEKPLLLVFLRHFG
jgi:peroxiredoxin